MDKANGNPLPQPKWYFTIGAHGGEFAIKAESKGFASKELRKAVKEAFDDGARMSGQVMVREAPPALVGWLNAIFYDTRDLCKQESPGLNTECKVPGGFIYYGGAGESATSAFVQVPGAGNITILDGDDAKGADDA